MALAISPVLADPLPGADGYPNVAFLARNDVPFDAQTAASIAAQLGAPMFITGHHVRGHGGHDRDDLVRDDRVLGRGVDRGGAFDQR